MSKLIQRSTPLCIALALILFIVPGFGQSIQNGKISGKVVMESGEPVPGVAVTVYSDALISGSRTSVTSESGTFLFMELPVGQYRVEASLEGFKKSVAARVSVSASSVSSANLILEQGQITEEVTVAASAPVVDARTSTIDTKINKEMMGKLPTSRDAFYDLTLTAPGMADAGKDFTWLPSPSAYGSAANENVFLMNGVNTTNPRGGAFGTLVNVNYNAVEEVRVVALGSKAEYGSSTGVAVDVVTKSGGNNFGGTISFNSQIFNEKSNMFTVGDDYGEDYILHPGRNISNYTDRDMVASLGFGGALLKNKVWFYVGANYMDYMLKKPLFEPKLTTDRPMFDLKLTTEPFKNHRAWVAYHFEQTNVMGDTWGDNVPWDGEVQMGRKELNNTISAQWQWYPSQKTFISAKYLGFWTDWISKIPDDAKPYSAYINWWKWKSFGVDGHFPFAEGREATRNTIQADVSHYAENFLGDHDMKFGVQYTTGVSNEMNGYFAGKVSYAYPTYGWSDDGFKRQNHIDWYGAGGMQWYVREVEAPATLTARKYEQLGLFFDDQWTIGDRLTINLGFRYDKWRNWYGEGKIFAPNATPAELSLDMPVVGTRAGSGDVFNMSSISPRLGLTYSLTEDGKTVVRANFGRYYMPIGMENLSARGPNMPLRTVNYYNYLLPWDIFGEDENGYIPLADIENAAREYLRNSPSKTFDRSEITDASWTAQVAPGTTPQYTDQFTFNLERELLKDFSVSASYIYKNTGNMMVNFPINRLTGQPWEFIPYPWTRENGDGSTEQYSLWTIPEADYNGDGVFDWNDAQWVYNNTTHEVRNMSEWNGEKIKRTYNAFQLVFNKRYSNRWQMMASLLYASSEGVANRINAQDWNIEGTNIMGGNFVSSPNEFISNMTGKLPFTPDWEVKINGSYTIPLVELNLGVRYRYNSGRYYWYTDTLPRLGEWSDGVIATGSRVIKLTDPKKLPAMSMLDLQLSRSFQIGEKFTVTASLDCFNIFNTAIVTNIVWKPDDGTLGTMTGLTYPRKISAGLSLEF